MSMHSGLLLKSAMLGKGVMLGPGTKGSLNLEVLVIVVGAGLEVSRRCTSPPGEMLRLWGSGDEFLVSLPLFTVWFLVLSTVLDVQIEFPNFDL